MSLHALFSSNKPEEPVKPEPVKKAAAPKTPPARKIKKSLRVKGSGTLK
jgi:hypothetical protein